MSKGVNILAGRRKVSARAKGPYMFADKNHMRPGLSQDRCLVAKKSNEKKVWRVDGAQMSN